MKKIYTLLLVVSVLFGACKKDDEKNAKGTLTAKIDLFDSTTKKWSGNKDFVSTSVSTVKSGNDYTVTAKDANGVTFTLVVKNVTSTGDYLPDPSSSLVKEGKTYSSTLGGKVKITTATNNALKGTFIFEGAEWSVNNGNVDASF